MAETILNEWKHFEWKIQDFFEEPTHDGYKIDSPCFPLSSVKLFLRIYTNGEDSDRSGYISLYLHSNKSALELCIDSRIGIKNADGSEFRGFNFEHTFRKGTRESGFGFPKFMQRSELLYRKFIVAPFGTLTAFCTLRIIDTSTAESASQILCDGTDTLIGDLKNLYFSSCHADITIIVKGKEFHAHRSILCSRSSVFESMFFHDTEERNSGIIEITDCDPETFEDFLLFLYTGKFDNIKSSNAVSLYVSADKYDVKELKDACVRCMIEELSIDVFCDCLHLATMQNEQELLKAVTDYFIKNAKTIVTTTKWQTFLSEHPLLGNELFLKLLN